MKEEEVAMVEESSHGGPGCGLHAWQGEELGRERFLAKLAEAAARVPPEGEDFPEDDKGDELRSAD